MSVKDIDAHRKNKPIQIIDVRTTIEWASSKIEDSVSLPITGLSCDNIRQLNMNPNELTIVVCLSAHRSIPGVRKLKELGFSNVYQLQGGMRKWWNAGLPTTFSSR